jgi:hypothetical protein
MTENTLKIVNDWRSKEKHWRCCSGRQNCLLLLRLSVNFAQVCNPIKTDRQGKHGTIEVVLVMRFDGNNQAA